MTKLRLSGHFTLISRDPQGREIGGLSFPNGVTVEGVNYLLNRGFRGGTGIPAWYVHLIDDAGFAALDPTDTTAAHAGWTEFTAVAGGNGILWNPVAAAGGFLDASPQTVISVTAPGTVRGAFLSSRQATGLGAGQTLYATGAAASGLAVVAGGTVSILYQLRLTPR